MLDAHVGQVFVDALAEALAEEHAQTAGGDVHRIRDALNGDFVVAEVQLDVLHGAFDDARNGLPGIALAGVALREHESAHMGDQHLRIMEVAAVRILRHARLAVGAQVAAQQPIGAVQGGDVIARNALLEVIGEAVEILAQLLRAPADAGEGEGVLRGDVGLTLQLFERLCGI